MTAPIANGESGLSVRTKLNTIISKVDGIEAGATGDQDLTAYQLKPSEGAFVDGDKTKLDNQSGVNTGDQDLSTYQLKPSEGAFVDGDKTKLDNAVESDVTGEPTGSDQVLNVVSLTQAEYDAGTPVATTLYVIV